MPTLQVAIDARKARIGAGMFVGATDQIVREAKNAVRHLAYLTERTDRFADALRRAARSAVVLVAGVSVLQGIRNTITMMTEFSRQLAVLQGVTSATAGEMALLTAKARELGQNTIFTAPEAAQGLIHLAQAGFNARQSVEAIEPTLDLATSAMIDMGHAANIMANTIHQFDMATSEAGRVADVLVATGNLTNTTVLELGQALEYVGPVAAAIGKSLEETAAVLGVLADRGMKASIAGTNLRGIVAQLAGPLQRQTDIMQKLRISYEEIDPIANSLADVFETLKAKGMGATEATYLFGRRNFNAALVLAANTERVRELQKALEESSGTAERNANLVEGSLFGAFRLLRSAIQDVSLAIGERGAEAALKGFASTTASVVKLFFNVDTAMDRANETAIRWTETLRIMLSLMVSITALSLANWFYKVAAGIWAANAAYAAQWKIGTFAAIWQHVLNLNWALIGTVGLLTGLAYSFFRMKDTIADTARALKDLGEQTTALNAPTVDFEDDLVRFEKLFLRMDLAKETFDIEGELQQLKTYRTELSEILIDTMHASLDAGLTAPTVDVAQLRKIFGESGAEALDAFLEEFRKTDLAAELNTTRYATSPIVDKLKPTTSAFNNPFGTQLDAATQSALQRINKEIVQANITKIPMADALRLIREQMEKTDAAADETRQRLEEFWEAMDRVGGDEIVAPFIQKLKEEQETIGKSKNEAEKIVLVREMMAAATEANIQLDGEHIFQLIEQIEKTQDLRDAEEERLKLEKEAKEAAERLLQQRSRANVQMLDILSGLEDEIALLQVEGVEREKLAVLQRINKITRGQEIEGVDLLTSAIMKQVEQLFILNEQKEREAEIEREREQLARERQRQMEQEARERQKALERMDELMLQVEEENRLLGRTDDAKEIARKIAEFYTEAIKFYGDNVALAADETERFRQALLKLSENRRLEELAETISASFGKAFEDVIFGVATVEEAIKSMVQEVFRALFQELVTRQLTSFATNILTGMFTGSAMGNVFMGGNIKAFATGGVVSNPTIFPMRTGMGLMGEAGPEAIMPLTRTSSGELGVRTEGRGGGDIHVHFHGVRDVNTFRENSSQITAQLARAVSGGRG